jgi:hypothetical protein
MSRRSHRWAAIAAVIALALVSGQPAQADVVVGAAIWSCQHEGSDQASARLDVMRLSNVDADEQGMRLSAAAEPFSCSFPWGQLLVEVTDYASPLDNGMRGAAEAWGLKVTANGRLIQDIPADSPRSCHSDTFNPFEGWIEVDAERAVVCRMPGDGTTPDCETTPLDEY